MAFVNRALHSASPICQCLLIACVLASASPAGARCVHGQQQGVLARVETAADADFSSPQDASADARSYRLSAYGCGAALGDTRVSGGFDYEYVRFEYRNVPGRNRDLHRFQLPLEWSSGDAAHTVALQLAPGIATSSNVVKDPFRRADNADFFATGRLFVQRRVNADTRWQVGVAHDRRFGAPQLYPLARFEFAAGSRYQWSLGFPDTSVVAVVNERTQLRARLTAAGATWHVQTDDFQDTFRYRVRGIRFDATISRRLSQTAILDLSVGLESARHHRFEALPNVPVIADQDESIVLAVGVRLGEIALPLPFSPH